MPKLWVTWLEMRAPPPGEPVPAPLPGVSVVPERLAADDYLALYRRVGAPYRWDQRLAMAPEALCAHLESTHAAIHLLRVQDAAAPAGFCEFDRAAFPEVQLVNFGLAPEYYGRRLGSFLLDRALRAMWRGRPVRIWLHTDEWDHPAAIRTYERAGFIRYDRRYEEASGL